MSYKKVPCPLCGKNLIDKRSKSCLECSVPYERSPEWRENMSKRMKGKKKGYPSASTRPEVAAKIQAWWTPERKEAKRQEMLLRNPESRYHGLSCKGARRLKEALAHCENCGSDGSDSRLDVHHRNGNKRDQSLGNLVVLCHRCHMKVHAERGETGWDSYHQKRALLEDQ